MKNFKLFINLVVVATSFMFFQCTSEYTPIVGPAGADGVDGVDGVDGADTSADACIECHSNTHRDPIYSAYALSKHGIETTMYDGSKLSQYGNRENCAACHTNQGFIDRFLVGDIDLVGPYSAASDQAITCTSCHDVHRSFDFDNDGNDYALRTLDPVALIIDPTTSIDVNNDSDPMGYSNTCINCHQPRTPAPTPDADGNYAVTSTHWGPHHGPQGTFLYGLGGAILPGAMPAVGDAGHAKGASCVSCHMGEPTAADNGGHTWNPTPNACLTCHDTEPEASEIKDVNGITLDALRATLLTELQTKGFNVAGDATIFDADGNLVPGTYPLKVSQAAFNYILLMEDRSNGIHNPEYAIDLATNSIDALQNN